MKKLDVTDINRKHGVKLPAETDHKKNEARLKTVAEAIRYTTA